MGDEESQSQQMADAMAQLEMEEAALEETEEELPEEEEIEE